METTLTKEADFQNKLAAYKKNPEELKNNREIAILYIDRQQIDKALPISKKFPDDLILNRKLAYTYIGLYQPDNALPFSEKIFAKDPENTMGDVSKLHTQLGIAYATLLQRKPSDDALAEKAITHFQKVIDKFSESKEYETAQLYLGATYHIYKQFDKAIAVLEKLIEHGKSENIKQQAEIMLKRSQDSAASAADVDES